MLTNTNVALLLVLVTVAAASSGSRAAGLSAALVGAVAFDILLAPPYGELAIENVADIHTAVLLLLIGIAVTELALWGRRQQARASEQRGYLDGILQTATSLAGSVSSAVMIEHVQTLLVDLLDLDEAHYLPRMPGPAPVLHPDGGVSDQGRVLDVDRSGLPTGSEIWLPVGSVADRRGGFRLVAATHIARPTRQARQVAAVLADHVGDVLRQEASR